MTIEYIQSILKKHHIRPNKVLGQNFLLDEIVMEDMLDSAGITSQDTVVEVGPGIGVFTERMVKRGANVLAIEKDETFLPILKLLAKEHKNFWYEIADALNFDYTRVLLVSQQGEPLLPRYKVVANIPYYITGKLIQQFLRLNPKPQSITLLVQKEVAKNIVANPPNLGLLGISVQIVAKPSLVCQVPARAFYPIPKVDSSVVHIEVPKKAPYAMQDEKLFWRVVRACFSGKRKQIHNTLRHNLGLTEQQIDLALDKAGLKPQARPQHVPVQGWLNLAKAVSDANFDR